MRQLRAALSAVAALVLALAWLAPARGAVVSASEFHHADFDHYFVTALPNERQLLDAGVFAGWQRTPIEFRVDDAPGPGLVPVCRFFSTAFGPRSSHFYTALASECATVKANPDWTYEGDAFYVRLPDANGACPVGTGPMYRLYNNGMGGAPNHKFTPYPSDRGDMIAAGWIADGAGAGVAFCVPVYFDVARVRTEAFADTHWEFVYADTDSTSVMRTTRLDFGVAGEIEDPEFPYGVLIDNADGLGGWEPYAGKMIVIFAVGPLAHVLLFDAAGQPTVSGCAFVTPDPTRILGPCRPMTGRKL